jgi:arginyl-tRNA synthetase
MMDIYKSFRVDVDRALDAMTAAGDMPAGVDRSKVSVEPPRDPAHGDMSTNAAMVLAKAAGRPPRAIADGLARHLSAHPDVTEVSVAGPGFLNWRLRPSRWRATLRDVLAAGPGYGDSDVGGGRAVNVEYVSANPTGPLHTAHARGAVVGDALAALLEKAGYRVTREYYINDAGAQVEVLARSTHLRYREALGETIGDIPPGMYPGEYLKDVGQAIAARDGDRWLSVPEAAWLPAMRAAAVEIIMGWIREDLMRLGVVHDVFTSERALVDSGAVTRALSVLEARDLVYTGVLEPPKGKTPDDWEPRPQTLFRATSFGDDVDRPLKKSDGSYTYFANDIAYHLDKVRRGCPTLIDVWGADHGGYVKRMQAATTAITGGEGALDVKLCQLVHLMKDGQPVKMSKRAGTFVTLADVLEAVGRDVLRFIMLTRRNDQTLEFDLAKVTEQSKENPVFYVQYAHARCASVLRHAADSGLPTAPGDLSAADLDRLDQTEELDLVRVLAGWPRLVEAAAEAHEPHRVAFYLHDLAAAFHALWNRGKDDATLRFLIDADPDVTRARLAMVAATKTVVASGLKVMGVVPVEELRG